MVTPGAIEKGMEALAIGFWFGFDAKRGIAGAAAPETF